jgi:hypothetical protein
METAPRKGEDAGQPIPCANHKDTSCLLTNSAATAIN